MRLKERLKECSYLWVIYTIIGSLFAFIIAMALYLLTLGVFTYYIMNSQILNIISQNTVKYAYVAVAELVFIVLVIRGLYRETGDTVLIDIIKHGGSVAGCKLVDVASVLVDLKDITVCLNDKECEISSLDELIKYNNLKQHGYIKFKNEKFEDICFLSDLKITASGGSAGELGKEEPAGAETEGQEPAGVALEGTEEPVEIEGKETHKYKLLLRNYEYSGYKLLSKQKFNTFEFVDAEEEPDSVKETEEEGHKTDFYTNKYINRLYNAKVFDYPMSFATDIKDGIKSSKVSLIIIAVCSVILFGIYGVYRNFSSAAFMNSFHQVANVDGLKVMTDVDNYEDYAVYIEDSLKLIPEKLRNQTIKEGWEIVFTKNDLSEYDILKNTVEPGATSGCTLPFYKLIVYKMPEDTKDTSNLFLMETIFHEFGHVLSLYTGSLNDEWRNIYNEDAPYYLNSYARSGVSEGFACCFATYLLNGELLEANTPKTYSYIDKIVKNYLAS